MNDHDTKKIIKLYFQSMDLFKEFENTPRDFGSGDLLYKSEIHTLETIGHHPGINLTELAEEMRVTKSAVSKFTAKLLDKDLIEKQMEEGNKKEVLFYLTSKGQTAFKGHEQFQKAAFSGILDLINSLDQHEKNFLIGFLERLIGSITIG